MELSQSTKHVIWNDKKLEDYSSLTGGSKPKYK